MTAVQGTTIAESQRGAAERLLEVVLGSGQHLWHNRPGYNDNGTWKPARQNKVQVVSADRVIPAGLFIPDAVKLYRQLLEIYQINSELAARFASYAILHSDWRDLKVTCAALMLCQPLAGQPVKDAHGRVEFHQDDYRSVGEGMMIHYAKKSTQSMTPKGVLRVAQLLKLIEIAAVNRAAGFISPTSVANSLGRWKKVAEHWLHIRESNPPLLEGLVAGGYKTTIRTIAKWAQYKPQSAKFYEMLGWAQKQADGGHRAVGLTNLKLRKSQRFDGLTEAEICEQIADQKLSYKDVVGRLPKGTKLTAAIMVACFSTLSDKDLRILSPTLEELGLLTDPAIRARWEKAIERSTDLRAINIVKNVKSRELKEKLSEAADNAVKKVVKEATKEVPIEIMFLIDASGSMQPAIERAKEALSKILAGFPMDKVHIASFSTMGTTLKPKAASRAGVQDMLKNVRASGGTMYYTGVRALHASHVRIPDDAHLLLMVAGDEAGEDPAQLANTLQACGYRVGAVGHIVTVGTDGRGMTVRGCARLLGVPYTEVDIASFDDHYQVPRILQGLLSAPLLAAAPQQKKVERVSLIEKIMKTPLLGPDGRPVQ